MQIPEFSFTSDLAQSIMALERLRGDMARPTAELQTFLQLKSLFQLLTSIASARIEGNRTTILDAVVDMKAAGAGARLDDSVRELTQLQAASDFIDTHVVPGAPITQVMIRELHRIAVGGLIREGDPTPGSYRTSEVKIQDSGHTPPLASVVPAEMSDLVEFINATEPKNLDLPRTAIAHHRFLWIHPFANGNGRVARLLTYAMLVKQDFTSTTVYRALNPTAVFGANRQLYYDRLSDADSLEPAATIRWCEYVINGLHDDLQKTRRLGQRDFVISNLVLPAIDRCRRSGLLSAAEAAALRTSAEVGTVKSADLAADLPGSPSTRSQAIRRLLNEGFLEPVVPGKRSYQLLLAPGPLTTFLVRELDRLGFLPQILRDGIDA
ncbi:Fic family protein [Specibacter cremeus]|uniref:Fic family protein n=1 Tax=Specibacter cremeus TaxID=1629051 RepID=UPI00197B15E7|nr:Fic family protein [Specibacter cremeus]